MSKLYYDNDADTSFLSEKTIAVIGYGSQGHAHALNLRDSGCNVIVGLKDGSKSHVVAQEAGLSTYDVSQSVRMADVVVVLTPDTMQQYIYDEHIKPHLRSGMTLIFAHGFSIRYSAIVPPGFVNVCMVAPKSPGHRVREIFQEGGGVPALFAVYQDATGNARNEALAYAKALGCTRAGVLETTFAEETETDLFGEQAVLCGGVSELVKAGFETLVEAGYQPELAYFECLHELKLIVDLMYKGGLSYMRYSISDTAEYGDYTAGTRVINSESRAAMKAILKDIQSGVFANNWMEESRKGGESFLHRRAQEASHPIEDIGLSLRKMMHFVDPVDKIPV